MNNDKYNEILKSIPSTLKMRLDNIKDYLYYQRGEQKYGSVSLMVGSGFSKNAEKSVDVAMLDWNELGKKFYTKLYGKEPTDQDLMFKSPIKLATMVNAEFGRAVLDKMIKDSLPDERVYPNDLYRDMLNLPWQDIFTTNYDSLLERTEKLEGANRRYRVVTNKETLIYTPSPRIIKLHGSFPDIHPYIITEEDFRTYPQNCPEFVNTVRQSLIENLFCLIGFSGDDPNFLNWIGWLRDVMGRLSMPVYLITYDHNIHGAQMRLFNKRNIQVVNLADIDGINSYREAYEFLFRYLASKDKHILEEWNCKVEYKFDTENDINNYIKESQRIRKSYKGWIVLPENYYNTFDSQIESYKLRKCLKTLDDKKIRLDLLFEFDWQLNISLTPRRFDWYISELENIKVDDKDSWSVKQKKLWLQISLLNVYRHIGETKKYENLLRDIESKLDNNTEELSTRFYNEKSLYLLGQLKYEEVTELLQKWLPVRTDYKARLLKSTIMIESGQDKYGIDELVNILKDIQEQRLSINFVESPLLDSCYQQVITLMAIYDFSHHPLNIEDLNKSRVIGYNTFVRNLQDLKEHFVMKHGFGINTHSSSWSFGSSTEFETDYINAYRILTWMEESGFPFGYYRVGTEANAMTLALSNIMEYEPLYGLYSLMRSCNSSVMKNVLSRKCINKIDRTFIDVVFDSFIPYLHKIGNEVIKSRKAREYFGISMLSRLSVKASQNNVVSLFKILLENIKSVGFTFDRNDFYATFRCLSNDSLRSLVNNLYSISYFSDKEREFDLPKLPIGKFDIDNKLIDILNNGINDKKPKVALQAYKRITCIYSSLTDGQKNALKAGIIKWRNVESQTHAMRESYHEFPYEESENVNIAERVNQDIDSLDINKFKIDGKSSEPISRFNLFIISILPVINYADEEHKDIMLQKIISYFSDNEQILKKDDSSGFFGGLRSFSNNMLKNIEGTILNGQIETYHSDTVQELYDVFLRYNSYGFHNLYLLSRLAKVVGKLNDMVPLVNKNLFINKVTGTVDTLSALFQILASRFDDKQVSTIINYVEFSNSEDVPTYINLISQLIKDNVYPLDGMKKEKNKVGSNELTLLDSMLLNLSDKVKTNDNITFVMDVEFETLRLAQNLIEKKPDEKNNKAFKAWEEINQSQDTFNDVRLK